jgi:hypothetical protein
MNHETRFWICTAFAIAVMVILNWAHYPKEFARTKTDSYTAILYLTNMEGHWAFFPGPCGLELRVWDRNGTLIKHATIESSGQYDMPNEVTISEFSIRDKTVVVRKPLYVKLTEIQL